MISRPLVAVVCDGPALKDESQSPCRASYVLEVGWGTLPGHVETLVNALYREWLADQGRVRCPRCLAADGINLEEVR